MKLLHSQSDRTKCLISNIITIYLMLQMLQCQKILFHGIEYFLHLELRNIKMHAGVRVSLSYTIMF